MRYSALALSMLAGATLASCTNQAGGEPPPGGNANTGRAGGRTGGRGGGPSDRPTNVEIEIVKRGSISRNSIIAGMLEPIRTVGVNAQLSGILLSLKAEEGHRVRQGDILAEIDARLRDGPAIASCRPRIVTDDANGVHG